MPWREPAHPGEFPTLGHLVYDWVAEHLVIPDGDHKGQPFLLTGEQYEFVCWWYRIDPETGKFVYRRGQLMRSQKWGKGPLLAALSAAELLGPVLPDGFDADGEPVGRPWPTPWVQLTAVSEDQADNTYSALLPMLREGPLANRRGLDVGLTRVVTATGGRLQRVTASSGSRLGQRITFACQDETHLWTPSSGGVRLAETQRRNLGGVGGRALETTNAYRPGERSVAESTYEAARKDRSVYVNARHARRHLNLTHTRAVRAELRHVYGDSVWVDLDRILAEIRDPATGETNARRYFLSELVAGEDAFFDPARWAACALPGLEIAPGSAVTLGFDGSVRHDCTGLVATDLDSRFQEVFGLWSRPEDAGPDWEISTTEVTAVLTAIMDTYDVRMVYADPWAGWRDTVGTWALNWPGRVREFDTTMVKPTATALDSYRTAIGRKSLSHNGDPVFADHVANAMIRRSGRWNLIGKDRDHSPRKIDLAMCGALSWQAYLDVLAAGWTSEEAGEDRMVLLP
ncbi:MULTISPECIES: hypothetical protein [unclassified Crossiella]|uniref:hypothetical protein n=1 Tax=unclassified Crossiella TaxID=2620835 RepID=UPI0020000680|nr:MULTISPECIES: hypothetical protein [unclassified Crossiella]MCK2242330.1 hypothetical protein [Crossiella sp. S99.2]MCK2254639.1 hypothetical protein [Crossiella sp. S99.1]